MKPNWSRVCVRACAIGDVPILNVSYKPQKISPKFKVSQTLIHITVLHPKQNTLVEYQTNSCTHTNSFYLSDCQPCVF